MKMKKILAMIITVILISGLFQLNTFAEEDTEKALQAPNALEGCIVFTSDGPFKVSLGPYKYWTGTMEYSLDRNEWKPYVEGTQIESGSGRTVCFRGTDNSALSKNDYLCSIFTLEPSDGSTISCSGNIEALLDYRTVRDGGHPAMGEFAFSSLFKDCASLGTAPTLPAMELTQESYSEMFSGCVSLTTAPALPAVKLAKNCYLGMFYGCTSLISAPALPATELAEACCCGMFNGCTSLTTAPALPATKLAESCYSGMFSRCTSLISAPALPATELANDCYSSMFSDCTSLITAPALPATKLIDNCYSGMFEGCTSLITAPVLPATEMAHSCYFGMFKDCISLTAAPALPATGLAWECYCSMFEGCTNLLVPPQLPAQGLTDYCYEKMFKKTGVRISEKAGIFDDVYYGVPYRIPSEGDGTGVSNALANMFADTAGPFTGTPEINNIYYLPAIPVDAPTGKTLSYTGIEQTGVEPGEGYTLAGHKAANAGNHTAAATLLDGYIWSDGSTGVREVPWTITPADISEATVAAADQIYDGTEHKPAVTITWNGKKISSKDYTLSYTNNVRAGKATVIVTGRRNFKNTSSASADFEIKRHPLTVTANSAEQTYNGKPLTDDGFSFDQIADGDRIESAKVTGSQTDAGSSPNEVSGAKVVNQDDEDVTDCYDITCVSGTLSVTPAEAVITVDSASKEEGMSDPVFTGTVEGLLKDDDLGKISYKRTGSDEEPGVYAGVLTAVYSDNPNYKVTVAKGDFTICPKPVYKAVSGPGGTYTKESGKTLAFTFKRSVDDGTTFSHFTGIEVDGKAVPEKDASGKTNWTAKSGSVIIELQPSYLDTLSVGEHKFMAKFDDGAGADVTFIVQAKAVTPANTAGTSGKNTTSPKTGDGSSLLIWFIAAGAALFVIFRIISYRKRQFSNR